MASMSIVGCIWVLSSIAVAISKSSNDVSQALAPSADFCHDQVQLEYRLQGQVFCMDAPLSSAELSLSLTPNVTVKAKTTADGTYLFRLRSSLWTKQTSTGVEDQAYSLAINASICGPDAVVITSQYEDQVLPQLARATSILVPTGFQTLHKAVAAAPYIPGCPASSRVSQQAMTVQIPEIQITDPSGACGLPGFATSLKPPADIYTDRAVCGSGRHFAWDQLGSGATCSVAAGCALPGETCEHYGLGVEWVEQQFVNYPSAQVLGSGYGSLEQAQTACVESSRTASLNQRCAAVIQQSPNPYSHDFRLVRGLGQAAADASTNTFIFHEIGQCSPKVDFVSLIAEAAFTSRGIAPLHEINAQSKAAFA